MHVSLHVSPCFFQASSRIKSFIFFGLSDETEPMLATIAFQILLPSCLISSTGRAESRNLSFFPSAPERVLGHYTRMRRMRAPCAFDLIDHAEDVIRPLLVCSLKAAEWERELSSFQRVANWLRGVMTSSHLGLVGDGLFLCNKAVGSVKFFWRAKPPVHPPLIAWPLTKSIWDLIESISALVAACAVLSDRSCYRLLGLWV